MVEVDFEIEQPRGRRVWRAVRPFVALLFLAAVWFLGVDYTETVVDCRDCLHGVDVFEFRVFGIPVSTTRRESQSLIECILRDLGEPCQHKHLLRHRRQRWWGMVFCACPCRNGVYRLVADLHDYDLEYQSTVIEYGEQHPEAADELWAIIKKKDFDAFQPFYRKIGVGRSDEDVDSPTGP